MYTSKQNKTAGNMQLFGNTRVMIIAALFVSMSIILGKYLQIPVGDFIRISLENLPVIMAGIFFGPVIGGAVGLCSDIIGCLLKGYAINPIITLGAVSIGVISGFVYKIFKKNIADSLLKKIVSIILSVFSAHCIGSLLIKTIGIIVYYHTPFEQYIWRVPTYAIIATLESTLIIILLTNKAFSNELEKVCNNGK